MKTPPELRRANLRLLVVLILFAIGLSLTVYLWMRVRVRANGGRVDPVRRLQLAPERRFLFDQPGAVPA